MKTGSALAAAVAGVLTMAAQNAFAQTATTAEDSCWSKAQSQMEMNACAAADERDADQKLNASFAALKCLLDPAQKTLLVAAQRAWIGFRDADCAFWRGEGSISSLNEANCRAQRSLTRAKELDEWPPNSSRSGLVPTGPCK